MDATAAPDHIEYLDAVAGAAAALDYKRRLMSALDLRAGQIVLDIGCGPGTDLGRQLVRLAVGAGFAIRSVRAVPVVFRDFASAEQVLGLRRTTARAVQAGVLTSSSWLDRLASEPFLAGFTFYLVVAER